MHVLASMRRTGWGTRVSLHGTVAAARLWQGETMDSEHNLACSFAGSTVLDEDQQLEMTIMDCHP